MSGSKTSTQRQLMPWTSVPAWMRPPSSRCRQPIGAPIALKNVLSEIGEAVKLLPPELLRRHPEVDWRGWAGLRDVISHQYFSLELPRLRPTIIDELPVLLRAVVRELST